MILKINGFKLFLILYAPILTIIFMVFATISFSDTVSISLFHTQILFFVLWSQYVTRKLWKRLDIKNEIKFKPIDLYFKLTLLAFLIWIVDYLTGNYYPENIVLFWIGYVLNFYSFIFIYTSLFIHYFILAKFLCMKEQNKKSVKPWLTYITMFFFPFTVGEIQSRIRKLFI